MECFEITYMKSLEAQEGNVGIWGWHRTISNRLSVTRSALLDALKLDNVTLCGAGRKVGDDRCRGRGCSGRQAVVDWVADFIH